MSAVLPAAVIGLLLWIAVDDLRRFRIRNVWVAALVVAYPLQTAVAGHPERLLPHGLFAAAGLAVLTGLFAIRAIGAGDAKLLAAALLWVGPEGVLVFALLLLPCTGAYIIGSHVFGWPARRHGGRLVIPYGVSIAVALIGFITLSEGL